MLFEEFQDGHHGSHLGYQNRTILAILNFNVAPMPPIKFRLNLTYGFGGDIIWRISRWLPWRPSLILERNNFCNSKSLSLWCFPSSFSSIQLTVWEEMWFEEFQDGCHGYQNATLNLYVAPMPPIKFQHNLTYGFGGDIVWRITRWPTWQPSWLSEQNNFCNSESLTTVTVMPPIKFWLNLGRDVIWTISRRPPWWPSWTLEWNHFSNSQSLCHCDASHQVSAQSDLGFRRRCHLKNFKMAYGCHREYRNGTILAILTLCHCDASHQVSAQSGLGFRRRCRLKNFKMAAQAAILDIGTERF